MGFVGYKNHDLVHNEKAVVQSLLSCDKKIDVVDWDAVKRFLRCHPTTVPSTEENTRCSTDDDPMGRILLVSVVSRNPPVDVVQEALRVFPDSLTLNVSCFFAACKRASPEIVRTLTRHVVNKHSDMDVCPYPWITLSHVTAEGAKAMLEEYPQGALARITSVCASNMCPLDYMLFSASSAIKSRRTNAEWWEKIKLMLTVAEFGSVTVPEGCSFHLLNALLRRIGAVKPQVFTDHKEAKDFLWLFHQLNLVAPCLFQQRDHHGELPLHVVLGAKFHPGPGLVSARQLITALIQVHPPSARLSTREGRLPLHLALENGWPCHDILLQAAPDALQMRDTKTGMYPFQTAACSSYARETGKRTRNSKRESALDITYTLLREDPVQAARGLVEGMYT